jgi:hypothetical protein
MDDAALQRGLALLAQNRVQKIGFWSAALIACGRARLPASRALCESVCDTACGEPLFAEIGAFVFGTQTTEPLLLKNFF